MKYYYSLLILLSLVLNSSLYAQSTAAPPQKEVKFTWDEPSSAWRYDSTHLYRYDADENRILETVVDTIAGDSLRAMHRRYNADNRLISDSLLLWSNNAWHPVQWLTLQFYEQADAIYSPDRVWNLVHPSLQAGTLQLWNDSLNNWDTSIHYSFSIMFDPDGRDREWIWSSWHPDSQMLINIAKEVFAYTPQGSLERRTYQAWVDSTNSFQNFAQIDYTYKSNGEKDVELTKSWNAQLGTWVAAFRDHRFHYDSQGNIENFERQNWQGTLWVDMWSEQTSYEPDNRSYIRTRKKRMNSLWVNDRRWHQFYDDFGNLELSLTQDWDTTFNNWLTTMGVENLNYYDSLDRMTEQIRQVWDSYQGFMVNEKRSLFFDFLPRNNVAIESEIFADIQLYPNPSSDRIVLQWAESNTQLRQWTLYDLQGKVLLSQAIPINEKQIDIDVQSLPAGIYLFRVESDLGYWSQRLIKQ